MPEGNKIRIESTQMISGDFLYICTHSKNA